MGFIVFEGIDGSGKSTQARMLYDYMSRHEKTVMTREPTNGNIGKLLRSCLEKKEKVSDQTIQLLFTADRSEHVDYIRTEMLTASVISDRYALSTIAYGKAAGLDEKWLIWLNSRFITPTTTLIIDVEAAEAMKRIAERAAGKTTRELFEKEEFLTSVRKAYLSLKHLYPNTHIINATSTKEETFERVLEAIKRPEANHNKAGR